MNSYFDQLLDISRDLVALDANEEEHKRNGQWKDAKKIYDSLREQFEEVRKNYIDAVLQDGEGHDSAAQETEAVLWELRKQADPSWISTLDYLEANLLPTLKKEASKSPTTRKVLKALPYIVGALLVVAFFGTRAVSSVEISAPTETKSGIEQRAAALSKALNYDDLAGTRVRRGGWLKGILLWPVEPTEEEIAGAGEFVGLALGAADLVSEEHGCPSLPASYGDELSDAQIDYLEEVSDSIAAPSTQWQEPPVMTVVEVAKAVRGC